MTQDKNERKTQRIFLRVSQQELQVMQENAVHAGLSLSQYARKRLLLQPVNVHPPEDYAALRRELSGLCNNVNQIARAVNTHARDPCKAAEEAAALAQRAYDLLRHLSSDGI